MSFLWFVLLLGVLVFVHELGHFVFLKLFDVKVLRLSLGVGPRLVGFRLGETEYCVAALPLGGYVRMLGEEPGEPIAERDRGRAFSAKPLWQRAIAIFAGPAFNVVLPIVIGFFVFAAERTTPAATIGAVLPGSPAAAAGLEPGDRVRAVDGAPVRGWEEMRARIAAAPGRALRLTIDRAGQEREIAVVPTAQVERDRLRRRTRIGRIGVSPYFALAYVGVADPDAPAARAGLRTGDRIIAINGARTERWADVARLLARNRGEPLRVTFLRPRVALALADVHVHDPGQAVIIPEPEDDGRWRTGLEPGELYVREVAPDSPAARIGLAPGDRLARLDGAALTSWEALLLTLDDAADRPLALAWRRPDGALRETSFRQALVPLVDDYGEKHPRYVFGVETHLVWRVDDPVPIEGRFGYAVGRSLAKTAEVVQVLVLGFVQLLRGEIPRDAVGGPIMLYYTATIAAEQGLAQFFWMMALISLNLALLNLLPIPVLDGGHLALAAIELVTGRPVSPRARTIAQYVGLGVLILLTALALRNDVVRYWLR